MSVDASPGLLAGYRVLDLCDGVGHLAGKLLGDLGAQVIKVERPGGDRVRWKGPFAGNEPDPEKSLKWLAYNTSKQGITLDIDKLRGREILLRLVTKCDALIESFPAGYLKYLGLGTHDLREANPGLVQTSITPYGLGGPYGAYLSSDLVLWALSGLLFICGDPDRPPVRISVPQAFQHAAVDAATGTVMALYHRGATGKGQRVVVSTLKAVERVAYTSHSLWDARGKVLKRPGSGLAIPPMATITPLIWECADGYVAFYLFGGNMGAVSNPTLTIWMDEEGMASQAMRDMDWPKFDIGRTPQEVLDRDFVAPIARFFKSHQKQYLWEQGIRRRVMVYPVNDAAEVLADQELAERGFWVKLAHPPSGQELTLPGPFMKTDDGHCRLRSAPPALGQHNQEVYGELLGMEEAELNELRQGGVI